MPWWSWLLIWTGLVLVLLAVLAVSAWWLFRKLIALQSELSNLGELLEQLQARAEELVAPYQPRRIAILRGLSEVETERRLLLDERAQRRLARREARLARARLLITADPMRFASIARKPVARDN